MLSSEAGTGTETGSVALAVLALSVVVLFTTLAFATAGHSLRLGADDRDLTRAGTAAELGVNEAYARIDGGETAAFSGSGTLDGVTFDYDATPNGSEAWTVRAEAVSADATRALQATISRQPLYPFTLFVEESLILDRNTGTIGGRVGSNGTVTVTGPSPGAVQELYRPDGVCSGCGAPLELDGPNRLDPVAAPPAAVATCPAGGRFEGAVDGGAGTVVLCDDPAVPVVFAGEVTVDNPPLIVHIGRDVPLTLDGAVLNAAGPASSLRLHVAGDPGDAVSSISATGAAVTGLVYGPGRSLTTADTTVVGSVTLGRVELTRGGRLALTADPSIGPLGSGDWRIRDLHPVAPSP